ncbi:MAG TPA: hypothetical protein VMU08_03870 [Rhizomicrobium sp.]|nr:hypothetical protein [Rhizomicrobium sp.]
MPMLQAFVNDLNRKFGTEQIAQTAGLAKAFAPGEPLDAGFVVRKNSAAYKVIQSYLRKIPESVSESVRASIYRALTSKPAKPVTFAWAPGYDFELNVWDYGCGMTVLLRGRYPADRVPNRTRDSV